MRKLIVLSASALVLALGAAQARDTSCHGSPCGLIPQDFGQVYAAPIASENQVAPWQLLSQRKH